MSVFLQFPVRHIEGDLVFSHEGHVTSYSEVLGFGYDFLDDHDKFTPFFNQLGFLQNQGLDLHYIILPQSSNIEDVIEEHKERMRYKAERYEYELLDAGLSYMDLTKDYLQKKHKTREKREYKMYIGVQLNPALNVYKKGNKGTNLIKSVAEFFKGFSSDVNRAVGLEPFDILQDEIEAYKRQAQKVRNDLKRAFVLSQNSQLNDPIRSLSTVETVKLIETMYSATPSNQDVSLRESFANGEKVMATLDGQELEAVRPTPESFLEIQEAYIEEISPDTLKFSKKVDGKHTSLYSRFYVITKFNDVNYFPNFEWLYHLQKNLDFPIISSIRAHYKDNERILKELSNKRLEYDDQKQEAAKAGVPVDLSVSRNEAGVMQLEEYFQKTGYPSYVTSYVFRVNAETEEILESRCGDLLDEMRKYGISLVAPYGEQPSLFMETLLGSKQINKDYKVETDPRMLAGMMFGATTAIGDNMGFPIGETEQKKDVFIYPELASKKLDGITTAFNSISMLIAGATGFGKSVLMNLITMLSVLCGAYALVIDPKGDRKKWKKGIPYIDKKYIRIWELGSDKRDKGTLDPFRTAPNIDQGKTVAENIFAYLVGTNIGEIKYSYISEAMLHASRQPEPCVGVAIDYLRELHANPPESMSKSRYAELDSLIMVLETFLHQDFINLLIGHPGEKYETLSIDKPLQILMIENLDLPNAEKDPKSYSASEKISTAIMISITSFAQQFMFKNERARHKVILQDEASVIDKNDQGRRLMDFIVRQGRYYNTTLLKGSQNASDHGNDLANLGMKFSFALKTSEEAIKMLEYFNLPVTQRNIEKLKNLPQGHCLFQDNFGRTDVLRVNVMFKQVLDAFDTSTSDADEKRFEQDMRNVRRNEKKLSDEPVASREERSKESLMATVREEVKV
ncbi:ATP-binding protein [Bacillus sp. FJAT-47783]|uniref:ATP-binding protein n=1 Tax=Bacillus sp. FJAT-47783 TaxID=2922712 RepID=UPI001FAB5CC4|nr:ATP-binding protein [Bacillus sp. FJAT-47783]